MTIIRENGLLYENKTKLKKKIRTVLPGLASISMKLSIGKCYLRLK